MPESLWSLKLACPELGSLSQNLFSQISVPYNKIILFVNLVLKEFKLINVFYWYILIILKHQILIQKLLQTQLIIIQFTK